MKIFGNTTRGGILNDSHAGSGEAPWQGAARTPWTITEYRLKINRLLFLIV